MHESFTVQLLPCDLDPLKLTGRLLHMATPSDWSRQMHIKGSRREGSRRIAATTKHSPAALAGRFRLIWNVRCLSVFENVLMLGLAMFPCFAQLRVERFSR